MSINITASPADEGQRLDIFCVRHIPGPSRAVLQRAIKNGDITVNGQTVKPRYIVRADDVVYVRLPGKTPPAAPPPALPSPPILYEDKDIVVINKPAGLTVQPGIANEAGTVMDWFISRYPGLRGGLVHRLDKDTSGVLVLAKTPAAHVYLKQQFKKRRVKKEYLAVVFGTPKASDGRITRPLARSKRNPMRRTVDEQGKGAITEWRLEKKLGHKYALLRVFPFTGRTHQIRVHLHFIGHPIVGDRLYTFKRQISPPGVTRQLLHAEKLTTKLPPGKLTRRLNRRKTFTAPLPEDFQQVLRCLRQTSS
ncbi:MAG: RluA family pseudouridine synthase [bacterium]